jgi:DNA-binding MarR family transcriptional regulator
MKSNLSPFIERFSSLRRSALRQAAADLDLPLVQAEILEYLAICNKYSNNMLAVVEYLGQTKGSVSQSLKRMEENDLIARKASPDDGRAIQLSLTASGRKCYQAIKKALPVVETNDTRVEKSLTTLLRDLQNASGSRGFSICHTCRYNETIDDTRFRCGLTGEPLTRTDIQKICREHEYSA